jgi:hypothetical protein
MANAEVQELIAAVAKKHKLVLGHDDPVLVTVSLNELLLARYLEKVTAAMNAAEGRIAASAAQHVEAATAIARQIVTGAGDYVAERAKAAILETQNALATDNEKQKIELQGMVRAVRKAAAVVLASVSLAAGICIGYWMQH